jgi:hypothetical protein
MAIFTRNGKRVSMAFHFASYIGETIDQDPFNGSFIDIAAQDLIGLMDRMYPNLSRQITFNPAGRTLPAGYQIGGPDTFDVDSDGQVTMAFDYDSDTYAGAPQFGIDYHIQSAPLKQGKHYFEIHVNSISQRGGTVGQNLTFCPTNWNLEAAFELNIGRTMFFDLNDRDVQSLTMSGTYQWTSDSNGADTKADDIIMIAYDNTVNATNEGRVFVGYNGQWGNPTDSSTMIDMNPANYDSANQASGNGGVGHTIFTNGAALSKNKTGEYWSIGFHPQGFNDGAGDSSGSIDVTIKVGTDITYTPPTGFKAH